MGTVLNNRTVYEMRSYFETHGTRGPYVRGNREAANMWLKELSRGCKCVDDMQPLRLSLEMCHEDPDGRLTAGQVLSDILDFQGEAPYCGHCCDSENGTLRPIDNDLTERGHFPGKNAADGLSQSLPVEQPLSNSVPALIEASRANTAMSVPRELTKSISNPSPTALGTPSSENEALVSEDIERGDNLSHTFLQTSFDENPLPLSTNVAPDRNQNSTVVKRNWQQPTVEDYEGTMTLYCPESSDSESDVDENELGPKTSAEAVTEISGLNCEWPGCHATSNSKKMLKFDSREDLKEHYRSQHLVHEFGRRQIVATRESTIPLAKQTDSNACLAFVLKNPPSLPATDKELPSEPIQKNQSDASERQVTSSKTSKSSGRHVRFNDVLDVKQPESTIPSRKLADVRSGHKSITPESLEEPILPSISGLKEENESSEVRAGIQIPKSSMVPSYYLAASNRFTRQEIDSLIPPARFSAFLPPPLFVYGSLMFPSILRARAEQFIGAEGTYSERHQRRLKTDSNDWSRINFSLQNTAEKMTPARLDGYDRFKPYGLTNAAITRGGHDSSVQGFVIFGLSEEALKCLDHLFSRQELEELYGYRDFERAGRPELIRRLVEVVIPVKGGDEMTINTVTYEIDNSRYDRDEDWDINKFVRSKAYTKLSGTREGSFWTEEESRLASTMGINLVLSGDMLCSAVLRKDKDKLVELLDDGHDANAPCSYHGSPLAAAAFKGREDFVELLIRYGADVNATGGEYHTPLVAATTQGHDECVRALIKAGADILAHGGKYISAIYQAVDYGDVYLAEVLLEKGAWLTKEYRELLDLSAERGNRIMVRMIEDYDVRQLYLLSGPETKTSGHLKSRYSKRISQRSQDESDNESDVGSDLARRSSRDKLEKRREPPTPLAIVRAVGLQALYLKGQRGKWTGIKGVKILRAAFDAGVSESILDTIRPHLSSYQTLVDFLGRAMVQYQEEQGDQEPSQLALPSGIEDDFSSSLSSRVAQQDPVRKSVSDREVSELSCSNFTIRP